MTTQGSNTPVEQNIHGRIDLTPSGVPEEKNTDQLLRGAVHLDEADTNGLVPLEEYIDSQQDEGLSTEARKGSRWWLWLLVAVLGLSVAELVVFVKDVFADADILGGLWLVILAALAVLTGQQLVSEWRGLRKLGKRDADVHKVSHLLQSPSIGQALPVCDRIHANLSDAASENYAHWRGALDDSYNDKEILARFEQDIVSPLDKRALELVSSNATASSVMIAVSPFALLDMLIVLWRNLNMMREISHTYGLELSYWGRIQLLRNVFKTMLYAGASEILADAGNYALGTGLTGKVSSRIAQGMGAGILTTRIGLKTIQACRPLPYIKLDKPGLNDISQQVLETLKSKIHSPQPRR